VGNSLKNDVLYEGGCYFLFEAANTASGRRSDSYRKSSHCVIEERLKRK